MIKILTDSSSVVSKEDAEKLGIDVLPLGITFGSMAYKDGVDITAEEFYAKLLEGKDYPHTSQPSPAEIEEQFRKARDGGYELLFMPLSTKISGTYESALQVKREGNFDNVVVFNTLCTTIMLELLVVEAAKHADLSMTELVAYLTDLRKRARLCAGIDTLEYLAKGGRLNTATAAVGSLLRVKPLITISRQGTIDVIGKKIGAKMGIRAVSEMLDPQKMDPEYGIRFLYSYDKENTLDLMSKMGYAEGSVELTDLGPIVGTHIGPNAYGYVYVLKEDDGADPHVAHKE